ncbi:hypothetical protein WN51_05818 [Melipona quadrifasciata]|uniref:Uncharacterized protein n=1 Tax=Melipona quadrifasciata TaxID=166423 RepID=A0A0N0BIL9_9HYME|nr:hypothetical protein WN51_05818 [Melipona quadrifasciata]
MVCTRWLGEIKKRRPRTEIKGKENRRTATRRRRANDAGERWEKRPRGYARRLCTGHETGPRNDFTGITPAKSERYGAAKCDVAIRHSRGPHVRACLPNRLPDCLPACLPAWLADWLAGWLAWLLRCFDPLLFVPAHRIIRLPFPLHAVLLDKTDDPDDPDPGRQAGAFLATNSWKRTRATPPTWTGARGFWPRAREAGWLRVSRAYPLSYCISRVPPSCWTPNDFFLFSSLSASFLFLLSPFFLSGRSSMFSGSEPA